MKQTSAVVVALCLCAVALAAMERKQLAGPPSEFADHAIPSTQSSSLQSRSAFYEVKFQDLAPSAALGSVTWSTSIYVETPNAFAFSFYAQDADEMQLELTDSNGNVVDIASHAQDGTAPLISYNFVPTTNYIFEDNTLSVGIYTLTITTPTLAKAARKALIQNGAAVIVFNNIPLYMHTYLSTYESDLGKPIGLITRVSQSPRTELGAIPEAIPGVILSAQMAVDLPDGSEVDVQMYDDGLHGDEAPQDGIYAASMTAEEVGMYRVRAILVGQNPDGSEFMRTTEHLINVIDNEITFAGSAFGEMLDQERMTIYVAVNVPETNTATEFRGYAEVWGKDANGNDVAVCWIASITTLQQVAGENVVPLEFNLKWANLAGANAPFTLQNAYLIDPNAEVPIDTAAAIPVKSDQDINAILRQPHIKQVTEATEEMMKGVFPARLKSRVAEPDVGTLILVHGYCAGSNPFITYPEDWTNAAFFLKANANLGTHQFSGMVDAFAESNGYSSYSIVGHSQGGMVGAHLLNYFWTGMDVAMEKRKLRGDDAANGRLIQSVGSPYLGCSGAGSAANLGKTFGVGCGENYDLTTDGASVWSSGLAAATRAEVFYYTTTYKLGNLFGDYCNIAINLILEWPNDGTSEIVFTKLPGATNMGNTEKQCHTTGMSYLPQYQDRNRNKQMNAAAAR